MNPRTTGILFLVAAVLATFVYLYEIRGERSRREAEEQAKRLFPDVSEDEIDAIELVTSDGQKARLVRAADGWGLTEPLEFPADDLVVDGMTATLAQLSSESVIEAPQAPGVYGLDAEDRRVRFEAGGSAYELRIGKTAPLGSNTYVSTDDTSKAYTVATFRTTSLRRPLAELRERRVLRFDRESIERIEARWPAGGVTLVKEDGVWRLAAPIEDAADEATVQSLLSDLSFLRAESFRDDPPPDAEVGLDAPQFEVELVAAAPEAGAAPRFRLAIGGVVGENLRVARGEQAALYEIRAERLNDLPKTLVAYRFKELASFVATDARRLEMVFHPKQGEPVTILGERGDEGWATRPEPMAPGRVSRLVAELSRLRASDILADSMGSEELRAFGLSPPRTLVRVWGDAAEGGEAPTLAEVHLGDLQAAAGIAAQAAGSERVYRLDPELAEHVPVSLEAFRNRFVSKAEEPDEDADEMGAEASPDDALEELLAE